MKFLQASVEEVEGRKLFVASDSSLDREGEIINVDGWKLENFKRNPAILWGHDASEPPIGTAEKIGFKTVNGKRKLVFEPKFHQITERAKEIGQMVKEGIVNTVSVGFQPLEMNDNMYTKQELLEISFVSVPANPEATQLALSKGFDPTLVKEIFCDSTADEKLDEIEGKYLSLEDIVVEDISPDEFKELQDRVARLEKGIKTTPLVVGRSAKKDTHRTVVAIQKLAEALTQTSQKESLRHTQSKAICKLTEMLIAESKK